MNYPRERRYETRHPERTKSDYIFDSFLLILELQIGMDSRPIRIRKKAEYHSSQRISGSDYLGPSCSERRGLLDLSPTLKMKYMTQRDTLYSPNLARWGLVGHDFDEFARTGIQKGTWSFRIWTSTLDQEVLHRKKFSEYC